MLILQLVLGIDLFRAAEVDLRSIESHTRDFSPDLMSVLSTIFSSSESTNFNKLASHPFFTAPLAYGQQPDHLMSVRIAYNKEAETQALISQNYINLAFFDKCARQPYSL